MLLLVGLGNPGSNYTNTRHNIGFKIIDAINTHFKLSKQKPKFKGLLTTGNIDEKKIYAIKPLTFMNNSGTAIKELIDYFKIDAKDVFVFHDDLDIDFGKIKANLVEVVLVIMELSLLINLLVKIIQEYVLELVIQNKKRKSTIMFLKILKKMKKKK